MIFSPRETCPEALRKSLERDYPNQNLRVVRIYPHKQHEYRQVAHERGIDVWMLVPGFGLWLNVTTNGDTPLQ